MKNFSDNSFSTIAELLVYQKQNYHNKTFLNFKKDGDLKSFSNQEFFEQAFYFACGLRESGLQKGEKFANFSYQNPIWLIVDFGAILAGAVTVPIFSNISDENLLYQLNHSEVSYAFGDNKEYLQKITDNKLPIKIINFDEIVILGKKFAENYNIADFIDSVNPEDLATIIYTSGSTGNPKGVELTHNNLISQVKGTKHCFPLAQDDVALSFLPLAHIFERMVMMFYISSGISIYFVDDIKKLGDFLKEVKPTLMTAVPRVLEKLFIKINDGVDNSSSLKKFLGKNAIKRAINKNVEVPNNILDKIFDVLVFKKLRQILGGKIKMVICGGAPLSKEMERFYRNIGVKLFCGYGLTESSPVLAVNYAQFYKFATVGTKFDAVQLKISDDGELLAKGPNIMKAYHKNPEATAKTIQDGWLLTGDLAKIDDEGFVTIIGRKKELFKTSSGKYVYPILIEQKIAQRLGFLTGVIIIAEGRNFVSALMFPDFDNLSKIKKKLNFSGDNLDFLKSEKLQNFVQKNIDIVNKDFDRWQQVKKFSIIAEAISIETGEITPSMKLKRSAIEEKFKDKVNDIYK